MSDNTENLASLKNMTVFQYPVSTISLWSSPISFWCWLVEELSSYLLPCNRSQVCEDSWQVLWGKASTCSAKSQVAQRRLSSTVHLAKQTIPSEVLSRPGRGDVDSCPSLLNWPTNLLNAGNGIPRVSAIHLQNTLFWSTDNSNDSLYVAWSNSHIQTYPEL